MYAWFPNLRLISLKKSGFSNFAKIEMTQNENRLFGRHFETVQIFYIFSWNLVVISVYIWYKDNSKKILVGKWF